MAMKRIDKYAEYAITAFKQKINQKTYHYKNTDLKYMFFPKKESNNIVVVFSSFSRRGIPARYNYLKTLKNYQTNKLFILDDFGIDKRGGYYLGAYPEFEFQQATINLISQIITKSGVEKCIFCGTSKGGWASLDISTHFADIMQGVIIGAPQFMLGNWLNAEANSVVLEGIRNGNEKNEVIAFLNEYLQDKMDKLQQHYPIYLHYSRNEHTYIYHIQYLIADLKKHNWEYHIDEKEYTDHWDVSLYFPDFLKMRLDELGINCK